MLNVYDTEQIEFGYMKPSEDKRDAIRLYGIVSFSFIEFFRL